MQIIIVSPSLDPTNNVSGVSSVVQFIIDNNRGKEYVHFELGRKDSGGKRFRRVRDNLLRLAVWVWYMMRYPKATVHYNFALQKPGIVRDPIFMRVARWTGHKIVVHVHGGFFLTAPKIPFPFGMRLKHVFSWDVPFIVLSESEKSILQNRFGAKNVEVLPNCVDLNDAAIFERRFKDANEPLVLGYLGRITSTKGMDYLLKACTILKENGLHFKLRIAGAEDDKGSYIPHFEDALGECFEYVGLVSGEKKMEFLRSLDIFLMPTFFEGLPMSLLECMSYGSVPVITPVGSIPEVVSNGENGYFIKTRDEKSIVDAITLLNSRRDLLAKYGMNAHETIFTRFSPKRYVQILNEIYDEV